MLAFTKRFEPWGAWFLLSTILFVLIAGVLGCQRESASKSNAATESESDSTINSATSSSLSGSKIPSAVGNESVALEQGSKAELSGKDLPSNQDPASLTLARELLTECLKKYRSIDRYQDRGQLVIQGATTLTLPIEVAWERPNRLGLRTGSMRGMWTSTTWEAQALGAISPFPNQRLVRPLPPKIDLGWIGDDTMGGLLQDPMSKPIQLELLLSSDSSESLFGSDSELGVLESALFDNVNCQRVEVQKTLQSTKLRWVLWIDPKSRLLRRIELPPEFYYPGVPSEQLAGVRCSIELLGADELSSIDWSRWALPSVADEIAVSRWVAPPPIASTPLLGKVIEPIDLKDVSGQILLDTAEPKKPWSVLVWVSDQSESRPLVDDLLNIRRLMLERELTAVSSLILVCSKQESDGLIEKLRAWNCDIPLAVDNDGSLSRCFQVERAPAMIVLDRGRRVQVAEYVITPQSIASIPELVDKLRGQQDLASRQLQQDLDNQSRFTGAMHRVALDKDQALKLKQISPFPFAVYGMKRDWKVELDVPLVSAGGVWYPQAALNSEEVSPDQLAMSMLDEDGRLQTVAFDGTKKLCARIETESADGAKKLTTVVDPWTHQWVAVVPEGLPRFWIASSHPVSGDLGVATAYNTQSAESPVCYAWIPQRTTDGSLISSKLAIGTSESRLMMIEPRTEQRLDGTFREPPVAFVPGVGSEGNVEEWDVLYSDGSLHKISNLTGLANESISGATLEARLDRLDVKVVSGAWYWGKHSRAGNGAAGSGSGILGETPVEFLLGRLASGETGVLASNHLHQVQFQRALTVRPEQAKLLGTTRLSDGTLMGLATGPSRILQLFSADLRFMDQASFEARVLGATIIPFKGDLKLVVALEREVSCWSIDVPDALPFNSSHK